MWSQEEVGSPHWHQRYRSQHEQPLRLKQTCAKATYTYNTYINNICLFFLKHVTRTEVWHLRLEILRAHALFAAEPTNMQKGPAKTSARPAKEASNMHKGPANMHHKCRRGLQKRHKLYMYIIYIYIHVLLILLQPYTRCTVGALHADPKWRKKTSLRPGSFTNHTL